MPVGLHGDRDPIGEESAYTGWDVAIVSEDKDRRVPCFTRRNFGGFVVQAVLSNRDRLRVNQRTSASLFFNMKQNVRT